MRGWQSRYRRLWRQKICLVLLAFLCVVGVLLTSFFHCRSIVTAYAESDALWLATKTANRIASEVQEQYSELCCKMISVTYNSNQQVSSIQVDSAAVNTVRTAMTGRLMKAMEQSQKLSVKIPVGTLSGVHWLSGFGPLLTFPMSYTPTVLSKTSSTLKAVGINQSIYQVFVHLDICLYVVTPGGRSSVNGRVSYPVAEAVLLGEVPDNLTEVYGDDQSLLGQIFDYGAGQ